MIGRDTKIICFYNDGKSIEMTIGEYVNGPSTKLHSFSSVAICMSKSQLTSLIDDYTNDITNVIKHLEEERDALLTQVGNLHERIEVLTKGYIRKPN